MYFFGETVEKIGPKKYKIKNGGFTTCVQPTPRWNLSANERRAEHRLTTRCSSNAIFNVKDVPLLYLPVLYYPTKEEGRATGFLLPTYGRSSLTGQQFSNAFFWAINRSHDATIKHDWFSKGDQGLSSEYRYVTLSGDGTIEGHVLDQSNRRVRPPEPELQHPRRRQPAASRQLPRPGPRRLLLQPRDQSDAPFEPLRRLEQPADLRRQRRRRLAWVLDQRHVRSLRAVHEHDQFEPAGHRAARVGVARRAAALPELSRCTSRSAASSCI